MAQAVGVGILAGLAAIQSGCSSLPSTWSAPTFASLFDERKPLGNPLRVPSSDFETVWNKTVAVVGKYFPIAAENRLAGTIRTDSQMTGTLIEPWSSDSATLRDRLEATLQTYRKFALVQIEPRPRGLSGPGGSDEGIGRRLQTRKSTRWPCGLLQRFPGQPHSRDRRAGPRTVGMDSPRAR